MAGPEAAETGRGGALRALISGSQSLIGCPEWCSWEVMHPDHEHLVLEGTEFVVVAVADAPNGEEIVEVRHLSAGGIRSLVEARRARWGRSATGR